MKLLLALAVVVLAVVAAGAALVGTGRFDVAATAEPGIIEKLAPRVRDRSIASRAASYKASTDPAAIARGLEHYRENCLPCHGAPGIEGAEFHEGMNPAPPEIDAQDVQRYSDGELFWIVKHGIRMTGMPAFSRNHRDEEIGDIVAFVRHAPQLSPAEREALAAPPKGDHHHHEAAAPEQRGDKHSH